jgi:hypothetical protein
MLCLTLRWERHSGVISPHTAWAAMERIVEQIRQIARTILMNKGANHVK